jgi:hypothetical protein
VLKLRASAIKRLASAGLRPKRALRGKHQIGLRVGKILNRYKMGKHFQIHIEEDSFSYQRKQTNIEKEESLGGVYVIRTNVPRKCAPVSKPYATTKVCPLWSAPSAGPGWIAC